LKSDYELVPPKSKNFQRIQHGLDARDFVCAEQIGLAQRRQHGEERLGAADFLAEKFKRVGQGVADAESRVRASRNVFRKTFI
jgi:hypothetical protein